MKQTDQVESQYNPIQVNSIWLWETDNKSWL